MRGALVAVALVLAACGEEEATEATAQQAQSPEPIGDPFFDDTSVDVEPEASARGSLLEIRIRADGTLFVGAEQVSRDELTARVREHARSSEPRAVIGADRDVPHGDVIEIIDLLRSAGVTRYSLLVAPASAPAAAP